MLYLSKFFAIVSGGHWVGIGTPSLALLLVIALAFNSVLRGVGQLLEISRHSRQKSRGIDTDNALSGLENIDISTGHHATEIAHIPHCDGIDLSCLDGFHH